MRVPHVREVECSNLKGRPNLIQRRKTRYTLQHNTARKKRFGFSLRDENESLPFIFMIRCFVVSLIIF